MQVPLAFLKCACGARAHTEPLSDLLFTPEALFTICYTGQVQRPSASVPVIFTLAGHFALIACKFCLRLLTTLWTTRVTPRQARRDVQCVVSALSQAVCDSGGSAAGRCWLQWL